MAPPKKPLGFFCAPQSVMQIHFLTEDLFRKSREDQVPKKTQKTTRDPFSTDKISYYFDAVVKERRIHDHSSYKQAEWNNLRNKLLRLPLDSFDQTLEAIEKLVDNTMEETIAKQKVAINDDHRLAEGHELYRQDPS
tara:strand:- start:1074 stop:1484 length:411 start_codon:yes stop_codon:yes gene_type:complete